MYVKYSIVIGELTHMEQTIYDFFGTMGGNLYIAIFSAMLLTGMGVPLPGELTLGFTGYLVYTGQIDFVVALTSATAGDLLGAAASYSIGYFSRSQQISRYIWFLMPSPSKLATINMWLDKYGIFAIVLGRLLPIIRGAIPIPAGFVRMESKKYILSNVISSSIWCTALIYMGVSLGYNWQKIAGLGNQLGLIIGGALFVLFLIWYLVRRVSTY